MTNSQTRPSVDEICAALKHVFLGGDQHNISGYARGDCTVIHVNAVFGEGIVFRFQDMPKIAEVCRTERLDFYAKRGEDEVDSVSFEGTLLVITAMYEEDVK